MKSADYWLKRFKSLEQSQHDRGAAAFSEIDQKYRTAQRSIEQKIAVWYQRFAKNNNITLQEAKQWLSGKNLDEFKWDVNEYIRYGQKNALNGEWMKQLENASARYHINRLEALKLQCQQDIEVLFGGQKDIFDRTMADVYRNGYYQTAFEIHKGVGVGWDFATLDTKTIDKVINKPWAADGLNFSDRIWKDKQKLLAEMDSTLTQNIILGEDPQKAIDKISKRLGVSKNNAGKLVMTEEAFFSSAGQQDCFKELDVEQYEIVATLDSKTSEICRSMDGKVFKMSEWEVGVTAPPFHPWCRTTTVPHFDDEFDVGKRAARGADGKTYYVPADMKYSDWEKSFVDGGKSDLQEVKPDDTIKKETVLKKEQMTKLHDVMEDSDFDAYFELLSNNTTSDIAGLYAQFADSCKAYELTEDVGEYLPIRDTVRFHYESQDYIEDGLNKFSVLGHECGHMFDRHIGRNLEAGFSELDAINQIGSTKFGATKMLKEAPSASDEFLAALRQDADEMRKKMQSSEWDEIRKDLKSSDASSDVQDFIDGFFSTWDAEGRFFLPWGHGNKYYNRKYNDWVKGFGLEGQIKQLYISLGFDASNQAKVKRLYRIYETASEAWANCASAETTGGKPLEFIKKYMPKTYEAFITLIGKVKK